MNHESLERCRHHAADRVALGWESHQAQLSPLEELMQLEEGGETRVMDQREIDAIRRETLGGMLDYFLREFGTRQSDPAVIGRRVVALAKFLSHGVIGRMSASELARACDETPASMSDRIYRECNALIELRGGHGQAKWQQGPQQRAVSAEVQRGNSNRAKR